MQWILDDVHTTRLDFKILFVVPVLESTGATGSTALSINYGFIHGFNFILLVLTMKPMKSKHLRPHRLHRMLAQLLRLPLLQYAIIALCVSSRLPDCGAYHIGDIVDTDILVDTVKLDALRSQMPLFGVRYVAQVPFEFPESVRTFSMQFEDGLWALPIAVLTKAKTVTTTTHTRLFLSRIQVEFIYSKSGAGAIHAVTTKDVTYSPNVQPFFSVEYHWVEEEAVYTKAGQAVMFLAVLIASVFFFLLSCGIVGEESREYRYAVNSSVSLTGTSDAHSSLSASVPKWD